MATTITTIVDPDNGSGTDYTSLDAWEDDLGNSTNGDLVTANEICVAQCRASSGTADTSPVSMTGWTTGTNNYIKIMNHSSEPMTGIWSNSRYRLACTDALALTINEDHVRICCLQFLQTNTNTNTYHVIYAGVATASVSSTLHVDRCILKGVMSSTGASYAVYNSDTDRVMYVSNCLIYDFISTDNPTDTGFRGISQTTSATGYVYNCTIHNCNVGMSGTGGTLSAYNCVVFDCADDFITVTVDHCASDDNDGTNNIVESSWTDALVDYANDDFRIKAGSALIGAGVDDPGSGLYSTDIAGTTRTSTWDVGAFESAATPVTGTHTVKALTLTKGTHTYAVDRLFAQTVKALTVTNGTHAAQINYTGAHTVTALAVILGTHVGVKDIIISHSVMALTVTKGTHSAASGITAAHTVKELSLTAGTHTFAVDAQGIHAKKELAVTNGAHAYCVDLIVIHTVMGLTLTPGPHAFFVGEITPANGVYIVPISQRSLTIRRLRDGNNLQRSIRKSRGISGSRFV